MNCIYCDGDTFVIDSKRTKATVIRRRKCVKCGQCYFTREMLIDDDKGAHMLYKLKKTKAYEQREHT